MKSSRTSILLTTALCLAPAAFPPTRGSEPGRVPSLEGTWLGTLKVSTIELRVVFNFSVKPDGSLAGTLDSPDQGAAGIPISRIGVENERVTVEAKTVGGRYEGTLNADRSEMGGKWTQGDAALCVDHHRRQHDGDQPQRTHDCENDGL